MISNNEEVVYKLGNWTYNSSQLARTNASADNMTENKVCVNCNKSTQKELPDDSIASEGKNCGEAYQAVSTCMTENKGQVSACAQLWDAFRACHEDNKRS